MEKKNWVIKVFTKNAENIITAKESISVCDKTEAEVRDMAQPYAENAQVLIVEA